MRHRRWLTPLVLLGAFAMIAAACSNSSSAAGGSTSGGASVDCNAAPGCVTVAAGAPIQIGTLLSVSGDNADLGQDSLYGVELAIDHLDGTFDGTPGQIDGHDVQLQQEDDTCSAEGGQAGATKLAANPDIVAVIGTSCSGAALGVADKTLGDKGIVLLSPSNTNPALTAQGTHNPYYFRTAHNDLIQGLVVADFAVKKLSATTAATIHDESPYTEGLTTAFANAFQKQNGQVVDGEVIDSSQQSYTPVLTKIGQKSPDLLYGPDYTAECALILKQGHQVSGLANTTFMGSDGCFASNFIKLAGSAINGAYYSAPCLSCFQQKDFYTNEFLPAYKQLAGTAPISAFHAHAYDALNLLAAAIDKAAVKNSDGSLTIPRTALRDAVQGTSNMQGIVTTYTCTDLGDCASIVTIGVYLAPNLAIEGATG
ncbi:MAG TPA: branched-chain amino acid ABC transporter substrate-binding protein, partial [Actinomycetota bacterium]